ncbi:MAG: ATP-dependent DNA ligase [Candidatus Korarchaeota archaeon]
MEFKKLVEWLEKIESTTKRLEMLDYATKLLMETDLQVLDRVVNLITGKIYPEYTGKELGIAERMVINALSKVFGKTTMEIESLYKQLGDLGSVAEKLSSAFEHQGVSVEEVYEKFDEITNATGVGSQETKQSLLGELILKATPKEVKYIVRIVLGKLRLGMGEQLVLEAIAAAFLKDRKQKAIVESAYQKCSDIGYVAVIAAKEGINGLENMKVKIGRPISSQLAEKLPSVEEIIEKMEGKPLAAEYKYDGIRMQAHVGRDRQVFLFSRRKENITSQFPDLHQPLLSLGREVILDGEIVPVNPETDEFYPFQYVSQRRGRKYDLEEIIKTVPVKYFVFDILYLDGVSLLDKPYSERSKILETVVKNNDRISIAKKIVSNNPQEIMRFFEEALEKGCEGLVCKNLESAYEAGKRGWNWIKFKRSYKSEMQDTVDLVVVGAFYGRGRRGGKYGALLMSTYNPEEDTFETVCKLGSGFDDELLAKLPEIFSPHVVKEKPKNVESVIVPDVWILPKVVMEVVGDEITISPVHTCCWGAVKDEAGLAIRFPRMVRIRDDKGPTDATSSQELYEMYRSQLKKIDIEK